MDSNTVRILAISGGGMKGYGANHFMKKFMTQMQGSDPAPKANLWEYFDVICGTSIGGILACGYAFGKSPEEMEPFFKEKGHYIFSTDSSPSVKPSTLSKINSLANPLSLVFSTAPENQGFYASKGATTHGDIILHQTLVDNFGISTLANLNTKVIIPAFQQDLSRYVLFSNYQDDDYFIGNTAQIVDVCRATSAAPVYLPAYKFSLDGNDNNKRTYLDGGIFCNNPVLMGINVALASKQLATRVVVLEVGCGMGDYTFDGVDDNDATTGNIHPISTLFSLLNIAMTGSEEFNSYYLDFLNTRLLGRQLFHYKFQPQYPDDFPAELDNSTPEWLASLENQIDNHYSAQSSQIANIMARLLA
jgi:hypothetical protein